MNATKNPNDANKKPVDATDLDPTHLCAVYRCSRTFFEILKSFAPVAVAVGNLCFWRWFVVRTTLEKGRSGDKAIDAIDSFVWYAYMLFLHD